MLSEVVTYATGLPVVVSLCTTMIIDVVILSHCRDRDFFDLNQRCIQSLIDSESGISFNIILVESNLLWNTLGYSYPYDHITIIQPAEAFNYNRFLNIGLRSCTNTLILFSNNDVLYHKGWLTEMLRVKSERPDIQSFCPFDRTSLFLKFDDFKKRAFITGYRVPIEFVGWCFLVDRSIFDHTGPFDETFDLYFQDNDFVNTLRKVGILHALVPSSFVEHWGGYTTKLPDASASKKYVEDRMKFISKWGDKPFHQKLLKTISRLIHGR